MNENKCAIILMYHGLLNDLMFKGNEFCIYFVKRLSLKMMYYICMTKIYRDYLEYLLFKTKYTIEITKQNQNLSL